MLSVILLHRKLKKKSKSFSKTDSLPCLTFETVFLLWPCIELARPELASLIFPHHVQRSWKKSFHFGRVAGLQSHSFQSLRLRSTKAAERKDRERKGTNRVGDLSPRGGKGTFHFKDLHGTKFCYFPPVKKYPVKIFRKLGICFHF